MNVADWLITLCGGLFLSLVIYFILKSVGNASGKCAERIVSKGARLAYENSSTMKTPRFWKLLCLLVVIELAVFVIFNICLTGLHTDCSMLFSDAIMAHFLRYEEDFRTDRIYTLGSAVLLQKAFFFCLAVYAIHLLRSILHELRIVNSRQDKKDDPSEPS